MSEYLTEKIAKNLEMNSDKLEERNGSLDVLQDVSQRTAVRDEKMKLIYNSMPTKLTATVTTKFLKIPVLKMWLHKKSLKVLKMLIDL